MSSVKKCPCAGCLLSIVFINFHRDSFRFVLSLYFDFSIAAFNMTKRDSQLAELLSPRVLRMESHDVDIPMDPITDYTSPPPVLPFPSSSTASSTTGTPLFQLPTTLQPGEYLAEIRAHTDTPPSPRSSSMVRARLSFASKRLTQTDTFGSKHWRPTSSASSDTFVVTPIANL